MNKVLIVDDEKKMLDLLALYLKPHNYKCRKALGTEEALSYVKSETFDIILLDIMMSKMDDWELCEKIRRFTDIPIIMVTAWEQKEDIIKGIELGVDDYITKPINEGELLARMEALLRRNKLSRQISINGLLWDEERFELSYQKKIIKLTPKEFALIGYLLKNPNRVFSREQLIELIWGHESETEGRTVDSHVRNLRGKIRKTGYPIDEYFTTVWGVGYKWIHK